jgi:hypothetical protein
MHADRLARAGVVVLISLFAASLLGVLYGLDWPRPGLVAQAAHESARLGLEHQVVAVLLVFRGYDTWLELVVVLAVVLGAATLLRGASLSHRRIAIPAEPLLIAFVRLLLPLVLLVAAHIGGFQGGAVAAAGLVLWYLAGAPIFVRVRGRLLRSLAAIAVAAPLFLTVGPLLYGLPLFSYPEADVAAFMAVFDVLVAMSITAMLAWLMIAAEPVPTAASSSEKELNSP